MIQAETDAGLQNPEPRQCSGPADGGEPCNRARVLITDDDETVLRLFEMLIRSEVPGIVVDTAHNGAEAYASFLRGHHAVLVLDLNMPILDGRQTFVRIQGLCRDRGWEMPAVVFCTGYSPPDAVRRAVRGDRSHALLVKPVAADDIVQAVRNRLFRPSDS